MAFKEGFRVSRPDSLYLNGVSESGAGSILFFDAQSGSITLSSSARSVYVNSSDKLVFWDGSTSTVLGSSGSIVSFTLDDAYDDGSTIAVDSGAVTLAGSHASNNVLAITGSGATSGNMVDIQNSGSGFDIQGTDDSWSVSAAGAAIFTAIDLGDDEQITFGADDDVTVEYDEDGNNELLVTGAFGVNGNVNLRSTSSFTQAGNAGSTVFTITAGDAVMSDGSLSVTDADNAETVTVINNTATTIGAAASAGVVQVESTSLTTGAAVNVQLTEGTLNGGFYYSAWDATGGSRVWSVGENGAMTIGGAGGSTVFTVTAGDAVMSDGSLSITDADNGETVTVINNTATTIGASASAGVVQVESTSLTTGAAVNVQLTEGTLNGGFYYSAWDATAGARVFSVGENGAIVAAGSAAGTDVLTLTAGDLTITSGDFVISAGNVSLTEDADGTALAIVADSATTNDIITVSGDGLTSGTALYISLTEGTLNGGYYIECYDESDTEQVFTVAEDGATTITGSAAGTDALTLSAGDFTVTSGDVVVSAGSVSITESADGTAFAVVANSATTNNVATVTANGLTTGTGLLVTSSGTITNAGEGLVNIVGTGITSGDALKIDLTEGTLNGGNYINCYDDTATATVFSVAENGATVIAGAAAGTDALTLTAGDVTVTSGDLTLSAGFASISDSADNYVLDVTGNASGASQAVARIKQDHTSGAVPCLELSQDDTDDSFVNFVGTAGAGSSLNTNTTSGSTTHHIKVEINGTAAWIAASTSSPS